MHILYLNSEHDTLLDGKSIMFIIDYNFFITDILFKWNFFQLNNTEYLWQVVPLFAMVVRFIEWELVGHNSAENKEVEYIR